MNVAVMILSRRLRIANEAKAYSAMRREAADPFDEFLDVEGDGSPDPLIVLPVESDCSLATRALPA